MESILKGITLLRGVHHACIYQEGKDPVSTFPEDAAESIALSHDLIDQIFSALKAINKSHNEIYFSIGDKFLVTYLMHETCIAILLTDKKINFPLVNMGIKSARTKVQRKIKEEQQEKIASLAPQGKADQTPPTDEELQPVLDQLADILKKYLGPAAIFVFEDDVNKWKKTYIQSHENLSFLVEITQQGLDPKTEQHEFAEQAQRVIDRFAVES
ncbi:MAG TPA: hypothetical protein EYG68_10680 [Leucothrix mucor]|nr:hypothetical protein [Leucothrix mucor]